MKLHKISLSAMLLIIFLVGCSGRIDESQWNKIHGDMSINQVEDTLGSPKKTYTDKQEMVDEINGKINAAKDLVSNPIIATDESAGPLNQTIEDMELIRSVVELDSNVKILQYELEYEDGDTTTRNIYLENDRVVYYDGARQ